MFVLTALGELIMLLALYYAGRRHVLAGLRSPYSGPARLPSEPRAAMIVPITGDTPAVRAGLESLLSQDYPNLRYVFVTREEADPATALVRSLIQGRTDAEHILSGPSVSCGQKNHNLLAGVARVGGDAAIYIFCDSTHVARPDLARLLIEPLADGRALVSGGFHRVVPLDGKVPTLGMLNVCMVLHSLQPIRAITQPWGGAMAVTREAFEEHGVAQVWKTNIVDDFSLGPHLAKKRIRTWPVAEACLDTPLKDVPLSLWEDWLTRQLLYLKFCTPEMWLGAIVVLVLFLVPPLLGALGLLWYLAGTVDSWWVFAPLAWLAGFLAVGMVFRTLSPRPVGVTDWLKGFFVSPLMTSWCYLRTWTTFTMRWRGIAYKVTWGGRVVEVLRQ
ncbi:MAG: glycosyltransferase family 2 protein [Thermodesulfobacteriota bacterium]